MTRYDKFHPSYCFIKETGKKSFENSPHIIQGNNGIGDGIKSACSLTDRTDARCVVF